jgi:hypothetical protein
LIEGRRAAQDWYDRLEAYCRKRMQELDIAEHREGSKVAEGEDFGAAHAAALAQGPDTPRPIRDGARRILIAMRDGPKVSQS